MKAVETRGWHGVLMHFRGCSGEPNRLARSYHSGETEDLSYVVSEINKRFPNNPLYAVGFSLGGNVLLKWLGETGIENPLQGAIAISIPFELNKTADHLNKGFSRFYQWWLVAGLKKGIKEKFQNRTELNIENIDHIKTFWEFDDMVTAPLHGFASAKEYYEKSSSRQYLSQIKIPTLIIQAKDDPFTPIDALPQIEEVSKFVTLEILKQGGHVGFVSGSVPWKPSYWLETRILEYIKEIYWQRIKLKENKSHATYF